LASKPELRNFLSHLLGGNPELEKYRSARMLAPEGQYTRFQLPASLLTLTSSKLV
jgi:hypothetical protein